MKIKGVFLSTVLASVLCFSGNLLAYSGDGDGTSEEPYQISSVEDWQELMASSGDWSSYFILTADINLAGVALTPVGNGSTPFTGVFDGNDNIISNALLNQPGSDYIGLFGYVDSSGQIHNLGVEDVNVTGDYWVGGLAGWSSGRLIGCYATGSITGVERCIGGLAGVIEGNTAACYATCSVSGNDMWIGGLVGVNAGTIIGCYATGSVSGGNSVGGLVGWNDGDGKGTVTNCYATGSVSGVSMVGGLAGTNGGDESSRLTNCYATGSVSGENLVGGLVGSIYSGAVTGCFWDIETSGQTTSAGGTGKSTVEMKTLSTFTSAGWDFVNETENGTDDIWTINEHVDYPKLVWSLVDFIGSSEVDFADYSFFAEQWLKTNCGASNDCEGADLDFSGSVDGNDLKIFTDHMLQ